MTTADPEDGDEFESRPSPEVQAALARMSTPALNTMLAQVSTSGIQAALARMSTPALNTMLAQVSTSGIQAALARMSTPALNTMLAQVSTSGIQAALARMSTPALNTMLAQVSTSGIQAALAQMSTPALNFRLPGPNTLQSASSSTRVSRTVASAFEKLNDSEQQQLVESASFFADLDAAEVLRQESVDLVQDPAGWVAETAVAAESGSKGASQALLLVRYLYDSFLLLVRRLNPSLESVERVGPAISLLILLAVVAGTLNASNPSALGALNNLLSTPTGIVGIYLSVRSTQSESRHTKHKPSAKRKGASKPRRKR